MLFLKRRICAYILASLSMMLVVQVVAAAEIYRGLGPEPDSLHIHQAQGLAAINLLRDIREGLVTFDEQGELVPGQAESWQVLDAGRRYRFTLRPDARWSNGDAVTSADYVRAWQRAFTPETAAATAGLLKDVLFVDKILKGEADVSSLGIKALEPGLLYH